MNILITQRQTRNRHGDWIDSLEQSYIVYLERLGLTIFPVPNSAGRLDEMVSILDPSGIVLSGGGDVDPVLYGGRGCEMGPISSARDQCEAKLLDIAIKRDIPVLGICRGMQFINVFFGGKLVHAIKDIDTKKMHGVPCLHTVSITDDTLSRKIGSTEFSVNSYHDQGIVSSGLGKDLNAFALFEGLGLIEAFHHTRYPIVGVQWHPERAGSSEHLDRMLLQSFMTRTLFWKVRT